MFKELISNIEYILLGDLAGVLGYLRGMQNALNSLHEVEKE